MRRLLSSSFSEKNHDYKLLQVLGCLHFPYIRPYNDHKLQSRSLPCVFLGYSLCQKGYKCLHLDSNRIFISKHVIFDENHFSFKQVQLLDDSAFDYACWLPLLSHIGPFFFLQPDSSNLGCFRSSAFPLGFFHQSVGYSPCCRDPASHSSSFSSNSVGPTLVAPDPVLSQDLEYPSPAAFDPHPVQINPGASTISRTPLVSVSVASNKNSVSIHSMTTRTIYHTRKPRLFPDHVALTTQ